MWIERTADALRIRTPAKINPFLEIPAKRPDGYHAIDTLMLSIDLCDELTLRASDDLELACDAAELTVGPDNLILKAARLLQSETGTKRGARIELAKRIPWAAGLGGGSSDAAAALVGLNELWKLELPAERLAVLAGKLGSDVPFFLNGPAARCTGRGEIVEPIAAEVAFHLLLVRPPSGLGTADVYRRLTVPARPMAADECRRAIELGDVERLAGDLHNRLREPAFELNADVAALETCLRKTSALGALMSGSGSALFALAKDADHACRIETELIEQAEVPVGTRRWIVRTLAGHDASA